MKANYPVEFLAASMTLDMGNTDKLAEFRAEAQRLGIKVEPPSINRSGRDLRGQRGQHIYYALAALKGVGAQAVELIVEARGDKPFTRLADFASRINPRAINKRVLESLAPPARSTRSSQPRARVCRRDAILAAASAATRRRPSGRTTCSAARRRADHHAAAGRAVAAGRAAAGANTTPSASSCPAIRSTTTRRAEALRCSPGRNFPAR
jgi:DNA polymerase III alpha subunit